MNLFQEYQYNMFRSVDAGYYENDLLNNWRFNYGIQNYLNSLKEHQHVEKFRGFRNKDFVPYTKCFLVAGALGAASLGINKQSKFLAFLFANFGFYIALRLKNMRHSTDYQIYLQENFLKFDKSVQDALLTGDARYIRQYVDQNKSREELEEDIDMRFFIW